MENLAEKLGVGRGKPHREKIDKKDNDILAKFHHEKAWEKLARFLRDCYPTRRGLPVEYLSESPLADRALSLYDKPPLRLEVGFRFSESG